MMKSKVKSAEPILKFLFEMIMKRNEKLAYAICYELDLPADKLGVPPFELLGEMKFEVDDLRQYVRNELQSISANNYPVLHHGDLKITLVNDFDKFEECCKWLKNVSHKTIGFDIEANFVCQSSNATQQ